MPPIKSWRGHWILSQDFRSESDDPHDLFPKQYVRKMDHTVFRLHDLPGTSIEHAIVMVFPLGVFILPGYVAGLGWSKFQGDVTDLGWQPINETTKEVTINGKDHPIDALEFANGHVMSICDHGVYIHQNMETLDLWLADDGTLDLSHTILGGIQFPAIPDEVMTSEPRPGATVH